MLVRVKDKAYSPTTTDIVDSEYDPNVEEIKILPAGVLVTVNSTRNNYQWFLPWNQIVFIMGSKLEMEPLESHMEEVAHATRQ